MKVKDIVCEKKKTSYKEVAETLIQELSFKLKSKGDASVKFFVYFWKIFRTRKSRMLREESMMP